MCTSKEAKAHIAKVLYEELCSLQELIHFSSPTRRLYTYPEVLEASISEVWDIALYLGVSRQLHKLADHADD